MSPWLEVGSFEHSRGVKTMGRTMSTEKITPRTSRGGGGSGFSGGDDSDDDASGGGGGGGGAAGSSAVQLNEMETAALARAKVVRDLST